jgi:filamentous hemagglutinin family protein
VSVGAGSHGSGTTLLVQQGSQNAIVNWQSFSIAANGTVNIVQPNASSALLNRVTGNTASILAGQLDANGEVYLINPNGIAITKSGVIDIGGGFVASTLGISDDDFKSGKLSFSANAAAAGVTNQGAITVGRGGYAALLGGSVNNSGLIAVPLGKVGLGAGQAATLDLSGDGFLQVAVPTLGGAGQGLIQSSGTISADGGTVMLSAASARAAARNAINLSGLIQAHSIAGHDGLISLSGGPGGGVQVSGTLDVSADAGDGGAADGGTIEVTGQAIALSAARLDASGANGGRIDIGGDAHGAGTLPAAATLSVDAGTRISANGGGSNGNGNGGNVVLWSDQDTAFAGSIFATGGASGGQGGAAEVSSKNLLQYSGAVDLTAAHGAWGTLLLDPYNITIESASGESNGTLGSTSFTPSGSNSILSVTDLQNALGSASVTVSTGGAGSAGSDSGNITVANALTWASGSTLTLSAYHSIAIDAGISITGPGGLVLTTNNGGSSGSLSFGSGFGSAGSVQFTSAGNSGRSLTINSTSYTLVDTMAELDAIDALSAVDGSAVTRYGPGVSGNYALAMPLAATGTTYSTALIGSGGSSTYFTGTFEGLGNTITGLTISNSTGNANIGLFGVVGTGGTVRDLGLIGGSVTGTYGSPTTGGYNMGELVGFNEGAVLQSYATGNVTITQADTGDYIGGLVGANWMTGTITSSYATGAVGNNDNTVAGGQIGGLAGSNYGAIAQCFATGPVSDRDNGVGGLVGFNYSQSGYATATITNSYATGAVFGTTGNASAGGLAGGNGGAITNSYATGVVTSPGNAGGLVAVNTTPGNGTTSSISNSYWDLTTSGNSTSATGSTGQTTGQLQGALPSGFSSSYWATGTGLYPYLSSTFPNGVQVLSGTLYKNSAGTSYLPSSSSGPGLASIMVNGVALGSATTSAAWSSGDNSGNGGFYSFMVPAGTVSAASPLLVYTTANSSTGELNGASVNYQTGTNVYGSDFRDYTAATGYSSSGIAAILGYSTTPGFLTTAPLTIIAQGASYALDQTLSLTKNLSVTTSGSAPLTVTAPITLSSNTLTLDSSGTGALSIEAPMTVTGAGTVALTAPTPTYSTSNTSVTPVNLNFPSGGSLQFTGGSSGSPLGTLTINGNGYTLINSMSGLTGIDSNGLTGRYALVTDLTPSTTYTDALIAPSSTGYPYTGTAFTGTFEGLGNTITGLDIDKTSGAGAYAALFGNIGSGGTVRDLGLVRGSVTGSGTTAGFVAGENIGTVYGVYETGSVTGGGDSIGGLIGTNYGGYVIQSYATGNVSGAGTTGGLIGYNSLGAAGAIGLVTRSFASGTVSGPAYSNIGGLVGGNEINVTYSYATGAVIGGSSVGGLVGYSISGATVANSYSTGAVLGTSSVGGLVGTNNGTVSGSYWDTSTSNLSTGIASGTTTGATGVSTANFQNASNPSSIALGSPFSGGAMGGTGGLYPYLTAIFPSGVQAVSGIAYRDGGITPYASTSLGAGAVSVTVNGVLEGTPATGANGYYYLMLPANSISSAGSNVLAFTQSGTGYNAVNGASYATATGSLSGFNVYGGLSAYGTTATLYSQLGSAGSTALASVSGYSSTPAFVSTLPSAVLATGTSFTVDQSLTPSSNLSLFTGSGVPLIIAQPMTISGSNSLTLGSGGQLAVNAPITVSGTGSVSLAYNTATGTNFSFGTGGNLRFTGTYTSANDGGNSALDGTATGALTINGTGYTLVDSMAEIDAIDGALATSGGGSVTIFGSGLGGNYALAVPVTATGTTYTGALVGTDSSASSSTQFTGTFEGLGNTITGLTISGSGNYGGLFGYIGSGATVRDLGLVGGSVTAASYVGGLAGYSYGTIVQDYDTGNVSASSGSGGLIGWNYGNISNSYATGNVSVTGTGSNDYVGGLVGYSNSGTSITGSHATGSVSSNGNAYVGGFVGQNDGSISSSYATGAVTDSGGTVGSIGGFVGSNAAGSSSISNSFATGAVSAVGSNGNIGGFVGYNYASINTAYATGQVSAGAYTAVGGFAGRNGTGTLDGSTVTIQNAFATGAVTAGTNNDAAGFVGDNYGTVKYAYSMGAVIDAHTVGTLGGFVGDAEPVGIIQDAYSTGALSTSVTNSGEVGGFVPSATGNGTITNAYWDTLTSGNSTASSVATGETTAQLQGVASLTLPNFSGGAAGGTSGIYPYLTSIFPNGVQVISGYAYKDGGTTALVPTTGGAGLVGVTVGGVFEGWLSTGAGSTSKGYYYLALPSGTLPGSGTTLLAYTQSNANTGALNGAAMTSATGSTSAFNVYGGYLNYPTTLTTYSAANAALSTLEATVTGYSSTPSFVSALGPYFSASGASFTLDQSPGTLATNFGVQTTASNAALIVDAPITLAGSNTLVLNARSTEFWIRYWRQPAVHRRHIGCAAGNAEYRRQQLHADQLHDPAGRYQSERQHRAGNSADRAVDILWRRIDRQLRESVHRHLRRPGQYGHRAYDLEFRFERILQHRGGTVRRYRQRRHRA